MKKFILGSMILILAASISIFAKPKRIIFKKGATKAVVSGTFSGYQSKAEYVIKLRAGQTFKLSSDRYITLSIADPNGEDATDSDASCNGRKTIAPTIAGDYKITVVECRKADAWRGKYKLFISAK